MSQAFVIEADLPQDLRPAVRSGRRLTVFEILSAANPLAIRGGRDDLPAEVREQLIAIDQRRNDFFGKLSEESRIPLELVEKLLAGDIDRGEFFDTLDDRPAECLDLLADAVEIARESADLIGPVLAAREQQHADRGEELARVRAEVEEALTAAGNGIESMQAYPANMESARIQFEHQLRKNTRVHAALNAETNAGNAVRLATEDKKLLERAAVEAGEAFRLAAIQLAGHPVIVQQQQHHPQPI